MKVIKVSSCLDCPFMILDDIPKSEGGTLLCKAEDSKGNVKVIAPFSYYLSHAVFPKWCPLDDEQDDEDGNEKIG